MGIEECVDEYWGTGAKPQAAQALTNFVRLIFEVDANAWVPSLWTSLSQPNPGSFTTQSNYLKNMAIYKKTNKGLTRIGDMQSRNTKMEQEAIQAVKNGGNGNKNLLKVLLNSAPANLRWGSGDPNRDISDRLDPIGTPQQRLTDKEGRLSSKFGTGPRACAPKYQDLLAECKAGKDYCYSY